jgi:hypothetical protein
MATVLEAFSCEEQHSDVRSFFFFLWARGFDAKVFIKNFFLFTAGSVCPVMRFHLGGKGLAGDE